MQFEKAWVKQNTHVLTSASLLFSQATEKEHLLQQETGIFFGSEVHFWNDYLFNFYKKGPQTLTNELHYTQGSTYLLWQSVSLEEWYLHMREKKPESRFLSCLLVSVTLVHRSSQNFRFGRKLGTFKMRKQRARAENTRPLTRPRKTRLPSFLAGLRWHKRAQALKSGRVHGPAQAQSWLTIRFQGRGLSFRKHWSPTCIWEHYSYEHFVKLRNTQAMWLANDRWSVKDIQF